MNKFGLLRLLGLIGISAAFSPALVGRSDLKLASEATIASTPPLTDGGAAPASISDIHPSFNIQPEAEVAEGPAIIQPDLQGALGKVGLSEIREQQAEVGLHAYSTGFDYTGNRNRH